MSRTDILYSVRFNIYYMYMYIQYFYEQLQTWSTQFRYIEHTGCPKRYETFLNLNKSSTFKRGIPKYPKYKIIYVKHLFQSIAFPL